MSAIAILTFAESSNVQQEWLVCNHQT